MKAGRGRSAHGIASQSARSRATGTMCVIGFWVRSSERALCSSAGTGTGRAPSRIACDPGPGIARAPRTRWRSATATCSGCRSRRATTPASPATRGAQAGRPWFRRQARRQKSKAYSWKAGLDERPEARPRRCGAGALISRSGLGGGRWHDSRRGQQQLRRSLHAPYVLVE